MFDSFFERLSKAHISPKPMATMVGAMSGIGFIFLGILLYVGDTDDVTPFWENVILFFGCIYAPLGFWWNNIFERNGPGSRGIYSAQRYVGVSLLYCFVPFGLAVGFMVYFVFFMMGIDAAWNDLVTESKTPGMKAFGGFAVVLLFTGVTLVAGLALGGLIWGARILITYARQGALILTLDKEHLYEGDDCIATIEIKNGTVIDPDAKIQCLVLYMKGRVTRIKQLHVENIQCSVDTINGVSNVVIKFTIPEHIHDQADALSITADLNVRIDLHGQFESHKGKRSKLFRTWRLNALAKQYTAAIEESAV